MTDCDKVASLKFKNRVGVIYDDDWISGLEYEDIEDENENYSE